MYVITKSKTVSRSTWVRKSESPWVCIGNLTKETCLEHYCHRVFRVNCFFLSLIQSHQKHTKSFQFLKQHWKKPLPLALFAWILFSILLPAAFYSPPICNPFRDYFLLISKFNVLSCSSDWRWHEYMTCFRWRNGMGSSSKVESSSQGENPCRVFVVIHVPLNLWWEWNSEWRRYNRLLGEIW